MGLAFSNELCLHECISLDGVLLCVCTPCISDWLCMRDYNTFDGFFHMYVSMYERQVSLSLCVCVWLTRFLWTLGVILYHTQCSNDGVCVCERCIMYKTCSVDLRSVGT